VVSEFRHFDTARLWPAFGLRSCQSRPRTYENPPQKLVRGWAFQGQDPCPSAVSAACPQRCRPIGHLCKRPFACALSNCKIPGDPRHTGCRVPFWTGNSGSKPPSLAIPTAIAAEKGRFALENRTARKAAIHDASSSRPAAVGCDRRDGRSQSRPVRQPDVAMAPLSHPRLAEALAPRPGTGGHARGRLTAPGGLWHIRQRL
jgi:hypothetical protein